MHLVAKIALWIVATPFILLALILTLLFALPPAYQHNYAVSVAESGLKECPVLYASERERSPDYDFTSTVPMVSGCDDTSSTNPVFYISHLQRPLYPSNPLGEYGFESKIQVQHWGAKANFHIVPESIKLTHAATENGAPLPIDHVRDDMKVGTYAVYYRKQKLPDRLYERVSFDVVIDGKKIKVEKLFVLYRKPHYDSLSPLMSV